MPPDPDGAPGQASEPEDPGTGDRSPGRWRAGSPGHLVRRFAATLWPAGPKRADRDWIAGILGDDELVLFRRLRPADRRHAAAVARRVEVALGHEATRPVLAAALLHDVGKVESRLGAYGRVAATLSGMAVGGDPEVIRDWTRTRGMTRRIGLYLQHPRLGADLLALAGSDPLTVAWAREHHLPPERWSVPAHLGEALKAADDD